MNLTQKFLQSHGLFIIFLFCFGILTPDLDAKLSLMDLDFEQKLDANTGSNIFKQLLWLSLFIFYVASFILAGSYKKVSRNFYLKSLLLLMVVLISLISAFWSDYPSYVLKRSLFQLIFISCIILAFYYYSYLFITLVSILLGVGFTADFALAGFTKNKNLMGINLAVLIITFHSLKKSYNFNFRNFKNILVLLIILLLLTKSKTSIFLVLFYFTMSNIHFKYVKASLLIILASCVSMFLLLPLLSYLLNDYYHVGKLVDANFMTGRGFIWNILYYDLEYFDKLLSGYGYGSYFGVPQIPYFFDVDNSFLQYINSAHNGFIELCLQFGALITIAIIAIFAMSMKGLNSSHLLAGLNVIVIHNITEASFYKDSTSIWVLYLLIFSISIFKKNYR
jgi:exopolysaccharide production protein ExoQ